MVSKFEVKITDKQPLTSDTFVFSLDCGKLEFKAGQFVTFVMRDKENKPKPRSYSIFSAPSKTPIQLLVQCVNGGVAGEAFKSCTKETTFTVMGPLGKFHFQPEHKKHTFIVTNTGLAPIHSMIAEHIDKDYKMTLIFGAKKKEGLFFHDEFVALDSSDKSFTYKPTLSREDIEGISKGYVQELIEFDKKTQYYICGSKQMVLDTMKLLEEKNIPKENVHIEIF